MNSSFQILFQTIKNFILTLSERIKFWFYLCVTLIQIYFTYIIFISFLVIRFIIPLFFWFDINGVFCSSDASHILNTSPIPEENINSYQGENSQKPQGSQGPEGPQGSQGPKELQGSKKANYSDINNPVTNTDTDTDRLARYLEPYIGQRLSDTGIKFVFHVYKHEREVLFYNKVVMHIDGKHHDKGWFRMTTDTRITEELVNNIKKLKENMHPDWRDV